MTWLVCLASEESGIIDLETEEFDISLLIFEWGSGGRAATTEILGPGVEPMLQQ